MGEHAPPIALCYLFIFIFSSDLAELAAAAAGCLLKSLRFHAQLTLLWRKEGRRYFRRRHFRLFVGDEESAVGGGMDKAAGGAEDEERKARESCLNLVLSCSRNTAHLEH